MIILQSRLMSFKIVFSDLYMFLLCILYLSSIFRHLILVVMDFPSFGFGKVHLSYQGMHYNDVGKQCIPVSECS